MKNLGSVETIVFACDAGMGTSAMGATRLKNVITSYSIHYTKLYESTNSASASSREPAPVRFA